MKTKTEIAVFGTGCFWCTEAIFSRLKGVFSVTPGYAGGIKGDPTYEEISSGTTGHAEVARIVFDPKIITYTQLLDVFWGTHNPTSLNRQGNDIGTQYRSIILYENGQQRQDAEISRQKIEKTKIFDQPIVTEIKPLNKFYDAEDYHRDYYTKNLGQPYCQFVISPKISHLREKFQSLLK